MRSLSIAFSMGLLISVAPVGCAQVELVDLAGSLDPLRTRFNAERDRPRILAIFSPV